MSFNLISKKRISQLPKTSGVYTFKRGKEFLYIGKAKNLKERIKNHLQKKTLRDNLFVDKAEKVGFRETDSEIEALILEAELIKKYKPKYNVLWRDDKNYFYVGITKEDFPRAFITHQPEFKTEPKETKVEYVGPFVDGTALKKTLKVLRKVFPYYSRKKHPKGLCPWCHLGLCPGPNPDRKDYQKNIKNLGAVLKGKNKSVLKNLEREMKKAAIAQDYEKAAQKREQVAALEKTLAHAQVIQLYLPQKEASWSKVQRSLQELLKVKGEIFRIEAVDVSNIQGQQATGSVITFVRGKPEKDFYRRFRIKLEKKPNDIAMIKEVLQRRLQHKEWGLPDLILIDGGKAQLNAAFSVVNKEKLKIPIIALAKKKNKLFIKNRKRPVLLKSLPREVFNLILRLRDEAHRFALRYHQKLRRGALME